MQEFLKWGDRGTNWRSTDEESRRMCVWSGGEMRGGHPRVCGRLEMKGRRDDHENYGLAHPLRVCVVGWR